MPESGSPSGDAPQPPSAGSRRRAAVAGLVALLPVIPIVVGLLLSSGGGAGASTTTAAHFTPAPAARPGALPQGFGALVALVVHPTTMRSAPAGKTVAQVRTRTEFGSPEALLVKQSSGAWLGVISTLAGNGRIGWIPLSAVSLSRVTWELKVSLTRRQLTVLDAGTVRERYTVAVGRPDAPTPTGEFAVTDRLSTGDPSGPYGCCILALSAHSPHAIQGWGGGNRIAIHSTPDSTSLGQPVSHGCVRLTLAEGRWLLNHIPLGTPALISS
ncbi:MAG: L,D-transpeptidase family protein [Solirubrobacterales bacterium]|nr:L,D-transpeptidase family protein [Solirubrobacterales bacterium]